MAKKEQDTIVVETPAILEPVPSFLELMIQNSDDDTKLLWKNMTEAAQSVVVEKIREEQLDALQAAQLLKGSTIIIQRKWHHYLVIFKVQEHIFEVSERRFTRDGDMTVLKMGWWNNHGQPLVQALDESFIVDENSHQDYDDYASNAIKLVMMLIEKGKVQFGEYRGNSTNMKLATNHLTDQRDLINLNKKGKLEASKVGKIDTHVAAFFDKRAKMRELRKNHRENWLLK